MASHGYGSQYSWLLLITAVAAAVACTAAVDTVVMTEYGAIRGVRQTDPAVTVCSIPPCLPHCKPLNLM